MIRQELAGFPGWLPTQSGSTKYVAQAGLLRKTWRRWPGKPGNPLPSCVSVRSSQPLAPSAPPPSLCCSLPKFLPSRLALRARTVAGRRASCGSTRNHESDTSPTPPKRIGALIDFPLPTPVNPVSGRLQSSKADHSALKRDYLTASPSSSCRRSPCCISPYLVVSRVFC